MNKRVKFYKKTLTNGVRLILAPMKSSNSVGINVFVSTGARHENKKNNGVSHFLEHMLFKGSKNYPSQVLISESIEGIGGILNGYTNSQVTNFWAKVMPKHFGSSLDVLSDMVLNPILRIKDIETEKGVVTEEIRMRDDNPVDEVMELSQSSVWGDTPLGYSVLGSEQTIKNLKRADIKNYHDLRYNASNIVISVAGDISEEEIIKRVEDKFFALRVSPKTAQKLPEISKVRIIAKKKETAQVHVAFTFPTFPFSSNDRYTLDVITSILGQGMNSRLFLKIRDKGLAYAVNCFSEFYSDTGAFITYAGLEKERVKLGVTEILAEFEKLGLQKVSDSELKKSVEKVRGPFSFQLEDPQKVAEYLGYEEAAFGLLEDPFEYITNIESVDAHSVRKLCNSYFNKENLSVASISPFSYEDIEGLIKK